MVSQFVTDGVARSNQRRLDDARLASTVAGIKGDSKAAEAARQERLRAAKALDSLGIESLLGLLPAPRPR